MSYKAGDKFIIELGTEIKMLSTGEKLFRVKGFNTLVFDENGLNRLKKYEEKKEDQGLRIGDEVADLTDGDHGVILGFGFENSWDEEDEEVAYCLWYDGSACDVPVSSLRPTGKRYPEAKALLDAMKKDNNTPMSLWPWEK